MIPDLQTLAGIVVIVASVATLAAVFARLPKSVTGDTEERRRHQSQPLAAALEHAVRLPPRCGQGDYPERHPKLDEDDIALAELVDTLWPEEEYLAVLRCPTPARNAYRSAADARAETGASRQAIRLCVCGYIHVRPRRRRTRTGGRRA